MRTCIVAVAIIKSLFTIFYNEDDIEMIYSAISLQ